MRFLVDAQLPPALARWLAGKCFVAEHVFDLHMETASDSEIWSRAESTCAVIVTKDEDFVALATSSSSGPRVLWVRLGNSTRRELLAWMGIELGPQLPEPWMRMSRSLRSPR